VGTAGVFARIGHVERLPDRDRRFTPGRAGVIPRLK